MKRELIGKQELLEIGERLKAIRLHLGYNQRKFAAELGISSGSLSEIEKGKNKPRFDVIYNLAKKYKVNIYYLLHGKGKMFLSEMIERSIVPEVYGPHTEILKEFLDYFNKSSLVRYKMMTYYRTYILENEALIAKDIKKARQEKEEREKKQKKEAER